MFGHNQDQVETQSIKIIILYYLLDVRWISYRVPGIALTIPGFFIQNLGGNMPIQIEYFHRFGVVPTEHPQGHGTYARSRSGGLTAAELSRVNTQNASYRESGTNTYRAYASR